MKQISTFSNFGSKAIAASLVLLCFLLFKPVSVDAQTSKEYTVDQIGEFLTDLRGGLFDIYVLSTSGGAYVLPGTNSVIDTIGRSATIKAKAGLAQKPIISANGASAAATASIFVPYTPNTTITLQGIEFNGINAGVGTQPILIRSTTTATACKIIVRDCYFHDFNNAAGNGTIRLEATSSEMDIQNSTFNNCSGRMLFFNTADGNSTTMINTISNGDFILKNCTVANTVNSLANANSVVHYKSSGGIWAKGKNFTVDHCTFYKFVNTGTSGTDEIFKFRMMSGLISITNCIFDQIDLSISFVNPDLTAPPMVINYCYLGFAVPPTGTNTITTVPIYTNVATLNFGLTNRRFFVGSDGLTVGDTRYYGNVGITPFQQNMALRVFPNPAYQYVNIDYTLQSACNVRLDIFDGKGQLINSLPSEYQPSGKCSKVIDISTLAKGVYVVQITAGSSSQTSKLVVNK
jgi:hypothetical protein